MADKFTAAEIFSKCGVNPAHDFHALSNQQVCNLLTWAIAARYRKPRGANGSRARYYHAMLMREYDRTNAPRKQA